MATVEELEAAIQGIRGNASPDPAPVRETVNVTGPRGRAALPQTNTQTAMAQALDRLRLQRGLRERRKTAWQQGIDVLGAAGAGVNGGFIANTLGLPGDLFNAALAKAGFAVDPEGFGTSAGIKKFIRQGAIPGIIIRGTLNKLGIDTSDQMLATNPQEFGNSPTIKIAGAIGENLAAGITGAGFVSKIAQGVRKTSVFEPLLRVAREAPASAFAAETTAAGGAGLFAGAARVADPGNPLSELGASVVGGAFPGTLVAGPTRLAQAAKSTALGFTQGGRERIAGDILKRVTNNPESAVARAERELTRRARRRLSKPTPLDEIVLTSPQLARDEGLLSLEAAILAMDTELTGRFRKQMQLNDSSIRKTLRKYFEPETGTIEGAQDFLEERVKNLGNLLETRAQLALVRADDRMAATVGSVPRRESSRIVTEELELALKDAIKQEQELWDQVPNDLAVSTFPLKAAFRSIRAGEGKAAKLEGRTLPSWIRKFLSDDPKQKLRLKNTDTMGEVKKFRTRVLETLRTETARGAKASRSKIENLHTLQEAALKVMGVEDGKARPRGETTLAALNFSRQMNDLFYRGPIGRVMGFDRSGNAKIPSAEALDNFVFKGLPGERAVEALEQTVKDPKRLQLALRDYFLNKFNTYAAPDGEFKRAKALTWRRGFKEVLDKDPVLRDTVNKAIEAQEQAKVVREVGKSAYDRVRGSMELFLKTDPDRVIERALRSRNATEELRKVRSVLSRDPSGEAVRGLKQGIFEHMIAKVQASEGQIMKNPRISAQGMREWFNKNGHALVNSGVYTRQDVGRLGRVVREAELLEQSFKAVQLRQAEFVPPDNPIVEAIGRIVGAKLGAAISTTPLIAAGIGARIARGYLTNASREKVIRLLANAIEDPEVFRTLIAKPGIDMPETVMRARLRTHLLANVSDFAPDGESLEDEGFKPLSPELIQQLNQAAEPGVTEEDASKFR